MKIKICGLSTPLSIKTAVDAGASYVGFVFFEPSPRNLLLESACKLAQLVPVGICKVALLVNPDDMVLEKLLESVPVDMLQLHGQETPERVAQVKDRYGLPVMKAVSIGNESDLLKISDYAEVSDQLLVDTKSNSNSTLPGGNGQVFDWRMIAGRRWAVPWMLAGGLDSENILEAVRITGANQVDISSGVECDIGVKDNKMIAEFIQTVRGK